MNISMIFHILGKVLLCQSGLLVLPLGVSLFYHEYQTLPAFIISIMICLVLGGILTLKKPKSQVFYLKESFVITALTWIIISITGALPFIISGVIPNPVSALFETVSGFTTTGASILPEVESLPKGILFWRSFTHWIGGMGVLVFILMLLPLKGGSHMNLMRAESPGPQVEKFVPKLQLTAKILYGIYFFLTLLQIILLLLGGMPVFDAVTTAFGTAGTGGFGIKNNSMGSYSSYLQIVVTVFMILFGINFNFYFLILQKKFSKALIMEEVRWYLIIILTAIAIITLNIAPLFTNVFEALKHSAFQVGSIITTTGYSSTDFNLWPGLSKTILVTLMFIGACAGSTGGGIKISRVMILFKTVIKEKKRLLHPQSISKVTVDKKPIAHETLRSVNVFFAAYMFIFFISMLLISVDNFDFTTNFTAVASALNNIGPGLEVVGPMGNFGGYSNFSKLILTFDMLAGRLEIFPLLILFKRATWQRF